MCLSRNLTLVCFKLPHRAVDSLPEFGPVASGEPFALAFFLPGPFILTHVVFEDPDLQVARVPLILVHLQVHVSVFFGELSLNSADIACDGAS